MTEYRSIQLQPSVSTSDEFYHPPEQLGNMEIWYADIYDPKSQSVFIVQITYGPDPLKKEQVAFVSFHGYTPAGGVISQTLQVSPEQMHINDEPYQVTMGSSVVEGQIDPSGHSKSFHILVNLEQIQMDVTIDPDVSVWLPIGEKVPFYDRERKGFFSWIPSIPRGKVNGSVTVGSSTTALADADGYYDHTYWETGTKEPFHSNPLFWDDILVSWWWLKIIQNDVKIAINEFCFRPWLNNRYISTILVCKGDSVKLSYNHGAQMKRVQSTPDLPYKRAGEFSLSFSLNDLNLDLEVSPTTLLNYQDMLAFVNPLSRPLVRILFGNPVAFYSLARVNGTINYGTEELVLTDAMAFYEPMVLNARPSRFEDWLRRMISRRIRRRI